MIVNLIELMDAGYDAKEPQMWPIYNTGQQLDRRAYVTASEIGTCARKIKFDKQAMTDGGYDPAYGTKNSSKQDWGFFERGHTMEAWVVDIVSAGWKDSAMDLLFTGADQVSFVAVHQSGTPDGVFMWEKDGVRFLGILEIKSIDPRTNVQRNLPKAVHQDQVLQNLDLVAQEFEAVPVGGELIYVNASDYKKRYQFHVPWSEADADALALRAEWIMEAEGPKDLPAEGLFKNMCTFCAHTVQCNAIIAAEKNEKGTTNELERVSTGLFAR